MFTLQVESVSAIRALKSLVQVRAIASSGYDHEALDELEASIERVLDQNKPVRDHHNYDKVLNTVSLDGLASLPVRVFSSRSGEPGDKATLTLVCTDDEELLAEVSNHASSDVDEFVVTYVHRTGKKLKLGEMVEGTLVWHVFDVAKFPTDWLGALVVNEMIKVEIR